MKVTYESEISISKGEMHNPRIPETALEHLRKRYYLFKRIERIYFEKQYIKKGS